MIGAPRSKHFNDVYFSREDGLAETRHVFLAGNNLPVRWRACENFAIFETGFGTGLNFLCTVKLFVDTAAPAQKLRFISVEKFPLPRQEMIAALSPWRNEFSNLWDKYLDVYPENFLPHQDLPLTGAITLTLLCGDVNEIIKEWQQKIDAWFLDGFKPSVNPDMWTDTVFENMARLSRPAASFATFTAAGAVRRGLQAAGFTVQKVKGFGKKRDMLIGRWP